jgi:hypothetical protein
MLACHPLPYVRYRELRYRIQKSGSFESRFFVKTECDIACCVLIR